MIANHVLILGNPNSGKSLLFNRLTGLQQKVANFPGVTVEIRSGQGLGLLFKDYPGVYSLQPLTRDEVVAVEGFRKALRNPDTRAVLYVMDATRCERSLYLLLQLIEEARAFACPVIVAVNVIDEVLSKKARIDVEGLARETGLPMFGVSAKTQHGLEALKKELSRLPERSLPGETGARAQGAGSAPDAAALDEHKNRARELARKYGPQTDVILRSQHRLDSFFLSTLGGPVAFAALMILLFQSIFSWAKPAMDFVSDGIGSLGEIAAAHLPAGLVADFVKDALFGGVGGFLTFTPQIFMLFLVIGLLEDSGYLARAAIILHRPLSLFGLSGRSFVPLLSGHACAIPAMMSARTIESPRKRLLTIVAIPYMTCSARLPVYALLIGGFVPAQKVLGGLLGLQGLAFAALYALGIISGLLVSGLLSVATRKSGRERHADAPFVVELPPYRVPDLLPILKNSLSRTVAFIKKAGWIIFSVTVAIWFLGYFPKGAGHLEESFLGMAGRFIEPFFRPMGMDWKIGVGVLTSFLAREVFVGTLGTLYGLENAKEHVANLTQNLHASGVTLATALALLTFYSLSMQCVSTLAVMNKETGSRRIPVLVFIGMTLIAYAASCLVYFTAR